MNTLWVLIRKRAADSTIYLSAGNAAAFLQKATQFGLALNTQFFLALKYFWVLYVDLC